MNTKTCTSLILIAMRNTIAAVILALIAASCGGQQHLLPTGDDPPNPTPTPVTIPADSVLGMGMIGQTWTFQNGYGETNTFEIQAVPPNAACRSGNNLAIHMTKTSTRTYWGLFIPQAEIWFLLHQNPDGSWRSTASLMSMPQGCPWCSPGPFIVTSDVIDNQPGMPLPYMIAPPTTTTGDHFIYETRVNGTGEQGLSYVCNIPDGTPLTGPNGGEYFRTDFYIENVSTPAYSGPAIVSDQYEGQCGHERWYFAPNFGIVKIETPYDGGQTKQDPFCIAYDGLPNNVHDPNLTIVRIH